MAKVHILVAVPFFGEEHLAKIAAVDPRVEVTDVMEELRAELGIAHSSVFPEGYPAELKFTPKEASMRLDKLLTDTEAILSLRVPLNAPLRAPRLKWVQTIGVGINHLGGQSGILDSDVMVTNAGGLNSTAVAEYAFYLMMMLAKNVRPLYANMAAHQWKRVPTLELKDKTIGIVGLGNIGSKVASVARAFEMRVLAARRSATRREKDITGVDELFPLCELPQMLRECDFVILAVPLTKETAGMIGEEEMRVMKPTSYLINIARGQVVKQDVLLRALKEGRIAGAGLDVFEVEPLPPDSELWELPNVIVSPHQAGISENIRRALIELLCQNLRRFLNDEPLINLVFSFNKIFTLKAMGKIKIFPMMHDGGSIDFLNAQQNFFFKFFFGINANVF